MRRNLFIIIALLFILPACGPKKSYIIVEKISSTETPRPGLGQIPSNAQVDVVTVEQQAVQEILSVNKNFTLQIEDDRYAWERARLFFINHTNGKPKEVYTANQTTMKNTGLSGDKYIFTVTRSLQNNGSYAYRVRCQPLGGTRASDAELNARNLARFIKDGRLEVSLL